ncbi:hypothetical protein J437_LFUL004093 [Ladona fulva]|uniref:Protocadherin Fat 4 n=1 Tax=Ladona fulva TaxID=123851 RepID=A0A8K0NYW8_LADFU|nr:hypothetical protein J437_LFUL004093 [Ladona fulva]
MCLGRTADLIRYLFFFRKKTGTPPLTGSGTVRIVVQDVNDHSPEFERTSYEAAVKENSPPGTMVLRPVATDKDAGFNAKISFTLTGDHVERFVIDQDTGELKTAVPLDREEKAFYRLTVVARDSSPTEPRSTAVAVHVVVIDENDNAPTFSADKYTVHIPDKTQPGQFVFGAKAVDNDIDQNSKIVYHLGGKDADKFTMEPDSGVIKAARELVVGGVTTFQLQLRATDGGREPRSALAELTVQLMPSHLFPSISIPQRMFTLSEDEKEQVLTRVTASSPKAGPTGTIRYSIAGGNVGEALRIDAVTGEVSAGGGRGLDFETAPTYEVWVAARDSDEPPLRSVARLLLNVTDANDNAPTFDHALYNATVLEEEIAPVRVLTLRATDADSGANGRVLYQLRDSGDTDRAFALDAETGELTTNVKLDRESVSAYTLIVEAVDQGMPALTGSSTVIVTVQDKNDNPPKFTRLFSVNVTENAELGTFVIQVTSSDLDVGENANASYSFTENPGGKFRIDPLTGNVTVAGPLDREAEDEYMLKVAAVDGAWRQETPLTITIQDQNDNAPEFEHSDYNFNFPELQRAVAFVGQVSATDRDKQGPNAVISYALKHPSDFFAVDPASGEVFSKRSLSYKHTALEPSPENQYVLTVSATDNGKPPMSSECTVTVNVVDANNNAPKFEKSEYFTPVPEGASVGQRLLRVTARDDGDFGVNAEVEYQRIGGNGSELFAIARSTGWITVAAPLRARRLQVFSLRIRAVDKGSPPQSDETTVTLVVTGVNRHTPTFTALSYQVIVPENEPVNSTILMVAAADADEGPNGIVRYAIAGGDEQRAFTVDKMTGAVTLLRSLDYDTVQEYHLNVTAQDLGFVPRTATAMLTVTLTDINDNAPVFNSSVYNAYLKENAPPKTSVYRVEAKDIDSPKNAIIQYSIVGGSGREWFNIGAKTGEITSKVSFDFEERALYTLDVLAANPDSTMHSSTTVHVHITGENEFFPRFVQPVFHFTVSESAQVGASVGLVQATDADAGPDGEVFYLLVGSSNDRGFALAASTGRLTVSRHLDRETQNRVVLTVLAKNAGSIRGNDTDEAQVVISVQDGNDPPEFLKPIYEGQVSEGAPIGTRVLSVAAVDKDVRPQNNQFAYSIIGGNEGQAFRVDPQSGILETASRLDRETIETYTLIVGAIDTGTPPQTGTTEVRIVVTDVNDNGPIFQPAVPVGYVLENEPASTSVMILSAADPDLPPNGPPFTYELVGGKQQDYITVEKHSGLVKTTRSIDREITPELGFVVEVADSGTPRMTARHDVRVVVLDRNDSPSTPRVVRVLAHFFRGSFPSSGAKIADIRPNDADTSGQYSCKILGSVPRGVSIPSGCELHVTKHVAESPNIVLSLSVQGNDGVYPDVVSSVSVEFVAYDNTTVDNSITIRAENISAGRFLSESYKPLLDLMGSIFDAGDSPIVFSIRDAESDSTEVSVAVRAPGGGYRSRTHVGDALASRKRDSLQQIFHSRSLSVPYSPCHLRPPCDNGGVCSEGIHVVPERMIVTDSPSLVFTSPSVGHDFSCRCTDGFVGRRCERRQDPCSPNPCHAGATCRRHNAEFICACPPGQEGRLCEVEKGAACASQPCANGGSCREAPSGGFFCLCRPGFRGGRCEAAAADSCRPNPCLHGGRCIPLKPGYRCSCPDGRHGTHCERSTFGFNELSYMAFPALDASTNDVSVVFATSKADALLVYGYGVQTGGRSDFVALELLGGRATFSFGGARTAIASVTAGGYLSDGEWHKVTATRNGRVVSLAVGSCSENGDICKECRPGDKSCYADDVGPSG